MTQVLLISLLAGCLLTTLTQAIMTWDCRRPGQACKSSGTCVASTGVCNCPSNTQGHDCSVSNPASACTRSSTSLCLNGGTCDGATCHCTPAWTGDTCQTARVSATCDGGKELVMTVIPEGNFNGVIKVRDQAAAGCSFVYQGSEVYSLTLAFDPSSGGCGVASSGQEADGSRYRTFKIDTLFDSSIHTFTDLPISFRCNVGKDTATTSLITGTIKTYSVSTSVVKEDQATGATMVVQPEVQTNAGTPVMVGDTYTFSFTLKSDTTGNNVQQAYNDIHLLAMSVNSPVDGTQVELVRNGCALRSASTLMKALSKTGLYIDVTVYIFKFIDTNDLNFDIKLKLCAKTCNQATCTDATTYISSADYAPVGRRRRRRQTTGDEGATTEVPFQVNMTVGEPLNPDTNGDGVVNERDVVTTTTVSPGSGGTVNGTGTGTGDKGTSGLVRLNSIVIIVPLSLFGGLLLIATGVAIYLCCVALGERQRHRAYIDSEKSLDTESSCVKK